MLAVRVSVLLQDHQDEISVRLPPARRAQGGRAGALQELRARRLQEFDHVWSTCQVMQTAQIKRALLVATVYWKQRVF